MSKNGSFDAVGRPEVPVALGGRPLVDLSLDVLLVPGGERQGALGLDVPAGRELVGELPPRVVLLPEITADAPHF